MPEFCPEWALTKQPAGKTFVSVKASNGKSYQAVLFDLDGTLIDQFRVIYRGYQYALRKLSLAPVTYDKVRCSVGGSIHITFGKLIPQEHVEEAVGYFREEFDRIWHEDTDILPGAEWILKALKQKGLKLCVFTNKEGERSRTILRHLGMSDYLDAVFGTLDTPWRKPQPEFTRHVIKELGTHPGEACMVGDSPYDVESAEAGGLPCYTVATGSHSRDQLENETRSAGVYPDLYQLGQAVFGLTPPAPIPD